VIVEAITVTHGKDSVTIAVNGTVAITEDGTEFGTFVHEITTADGSLGIVITKLSGNEDTHEIGTTTGADHVYGTVIVSGTVTNELTGTVAIFDVGITVITLNGTLLGTAVHGKATNVGYD
jgi:hypothetical protein